MGTPTKFQPERNNTIARFIVSYNEEAKDPLHEPIIEMIHPDQPAPNLAKKTWYLGNQPFPGARIIVYFEPGTKRFFRPVEGLLKENLRALTFELFDDVESEDIEDDGYDIDEPEDADYAEVADEGIVYGSDDEDDDDLGEYGLELYEYDDDDTGEYELSRE